MISFILPVFLSVRRGLTGEIMIFFASPFQTTNFCFFLWIQGYRTLSLETRKILWEKTIMGIAISPILGMCTHTGSVGYWLELEL